MTIHDDFKSKGPDLLVDLASHVAATLVELLEMRQDLAEHAGYEVADRIASHWRGQHIYVPMGLAPKALSRNRLIYEEFNGRNHSELARKHGVSLVWLYKIIKTVHKEEQARRQPDMFAKSEDKS
jgi:Mor family transcriptional regulator